MFKLQCVKIKHIRLFNELSEKLIYGPHGLTHMHHLKENVATFHLYQFLHYRNQRS
jgi:hypothetical protein